jgi:hypothetical protein
MLRRTVAKGSPNDSLSIRDLTVTGSISGPAYSNLLSAIEALTANGQRIGGGIVAASTYGGKAQFTTDGTDDQVQIQAAIASCVAAGGGTVWLTEGTYNTTAAIDLSFSNVTLRGLGPATVIKKNCNDYAIEAIGAAGAHIQGVRILDMTITRDAADTNDVVLVYASYLDKMSILGVEFFNPWAACIRADYCPSSFISQCRIYGDGSATLAPFGIVCGYGDNSIIGDNIIESLIGTESAGGIAATGNNLSICSNNISGVCSGVGAVSPTPGDFHGIRLLAGGDQTGNVIADNRITDCWGSPTGDAIVDIGIGISDATAIGTIVRGNLMRNNGNLILRGNCESATDPCITGQAGNTETNCTFARSTDFAHNGTYSYKFTKTNAKNTACTVYFHDALATADLVGLVPGCSYTLSCHVYVPTASGASVSEIVLGIIDYIPAAWAGLEQAAAGAVDTWNAVTRTYASRASATGFGVYITVNANTMETNEYFYVDDIRLRPDGVHNEHGQNYSDAGTGTQASGNAWQSPFQV